MSHFDENGEHVHPNGDLEIDPTHHRFMTDPRYNAVRSTWAISHAADVSDATARAVAEIVPAAPPTT